jgi:hypothetical protein
MDGIQSSSADTTMLISFCFSFILRSDHLQIDRSLSNWKDINESYENVRIGSLLYQLHLLFLYVCMYGDFLVYGL